MKGLDEGRKVTNKAKVIKSQGLHEDLGKHVEITPGDGWCVAVGVGWR
jgi:hypothetical protein